LQASLPLSCSLAPRQRRMQASLPLACSPAPRQRIFSSRGAQRARHQAGPSSFLAVVTWPIWSMVLRPGDGRLVVLQLSVSAWAVAYMPLRRRHARSGGVSSTTSVVAALLSSRVNARCHVGKLVLRNSRVVCCCLQEPLQAVHPLLTHPSTEQIAQTQVSFFLVKLRSSH